MTERHAEAHRFYLANWVTALFIMSSVGGTVALWFAVPDLLRDAGGDTGKVIGALAILAVFLGLLILPEAYLVTRRLVGVPLLVIDRRGIVFGGSWDRDLAVEWHNVRRITVRTTRSNGVTDHMLVIDPIRPKPVRQRAMNIRQKAVLGLNRLMFGSPVGTSTVYLGGGWKAVGEGLSQHYSGAIALEGKSGGRA